MDSFTRVKVIKMKTYLPIFLILLFFSCNRAYEAPVVEQNTDYKLSSVRLDRELFQSDSAIVAIIKEYPEFAKVYVENIMRLAPVSSPMIKDQAASFVNNDLWKGLQNEIDSVFSNHEPLVADIEKKLRKAKSVLPSLNYPNDLYLFNSGFNVAIYPDTAFLGVGLEWFLGKDSKYISMLPPESFPMYKRNKMQKENLVPDLLRGFFFYQLYDEKYEKDALSLMQFYGKALFVLKQVTGFGDADVLNYTQQELAWAQKNQKLVWRTLVQQDWLYSNNSKVMSELTKDGPFTKGFDQESPSRLGWYIGYRMMVDYANDNKEKTLEEIINTPVKEVLLHYKKP